MRGALAPDDVQAITTGRQGAHRDVLGAWQSAHLAAGGIGNLQPEAVGQTVGQAQGVRHRDGRRRLLLAAKALGLGAIWTAGWPVAERVAHLRRILNIPATHMPLNVIPVGYAAENPPPKNKWKPERIHRDGWV